MNVKMLEISNKVRRSESALKRNSHASPGEIGIVVEISQDISHLHGPLYCVLWRLDTSSRSRQYYTWCCAEDLVLGWGEEHEFDPQDGEEPITYWWEGIGHNEVRMLIEESFQRGKNYAVKLERLKRSVDV